MVVVLGVGRDWASRVALSSPLLAPLIVLSAAEWEQAAAFVCAATVPVTFAKPPRYEENRGGGDHDGVGGVAARIPLESSGETSEAPIATIRISLSFVSFVIWMAKLETVLFVRVR